MLVSAEKSSIPGEKGRADICNQTGTNNEGTHRTQQMPKNN